MEKLRQRLEENKVFIEKPVIFKDILKRFLEKLAAADKTPAYDWDLIMCEYLAQYKLPWKCEIEDYYKSDEIAKHSFLYKDVGGILKWLSEKNYIMVILTNGLHKYQDSVISKLELQKFFKKIVMPDPTIFNFVKPNPDIFKFATEGFPTPHISIGDSLYFDVFGAKCAGFKAIWLMRRLPKKYVDLPLSARTEKINQNHSFLLKYIIESAPFLKASTQELNLELFKPDTVIANLNELKEIL